MRLIHTVIALFVLAFAFVHITLVETGPLTPPASADAGLWSFKRCDHTVYMLDRENCRMALMEAEPPECIAAGGSSPSCRAITPVLLELRKLLRLGMVLAALLAIGNGAYGALMSGKPKMSMLWAARNSAALILAADALAFIVLYILTDGFLPVDKYGTARLWTILGMVLVILQRLYVPGEKPPKMDSLVDGEVSV